MLKAIGQAQHSITFETYIYWSETIGRAVRRRRWMARALALACGCNVLLDWVGSAKMDAALSRAEMKRAAWKVERYHSRIGRSLFRMNNRTHRKVLVVDGAIGCRLAWASPSRSGAATRRTRALARHPLSSRRSGGSQVQSVFMDNWIKATGRGVARRPYFPRAECRGRAGAQMFSSSPPAGSESMQLMYLLALTAATHSIQPVQLVLRARRIGGKALVPPRGVCVGVQNHHTRRRDR